MKNIVIKKVIIGGVLHPTMSIQVSKTNEYDLFFTTNDTTFLLDESCIIGRDFVLKQVNSKDIPRDAFYSICLPKSAKEIKIYAKNNETNETILLTVVTTNIIKRIFSRIIYEFRLIPNRVKKIIRIFKKIIKVLLQNHFIIKPKLIKRYISSLKNNLGSNNVENKFSDPLSQPDYLNWIDENHKETEYKELKYKPLISVIVPVYNVNSLYLDECVSSVLNQSYQNFELILVDDCSTSEDTKQSLKKYKKNKKIKVIYRKKNGHISECTNTGIENAEGEFISLLDNDDVLDKDALYYTVLALNNDKKLDMIYSDEDKIYFDGNYYFPHFKPDFSPDTLLSSNYICHFTTLRTEIVKELGGFRSEYNGAQDYDMFLRFTEKTKRIYHIPKILYHWRMIPSSTAANADSKNYAYIAGQKALEDALKRRKIKGRVNLIGTPQMYDIEYLYEKEPKISIIIPTKDRAKMLSKCLESIYSNTDYKNYEIIVINNNSEEKKTFELLEKYKNKKDNFKYINLNCEFNYSYINNEAVKVSTGEYLVFLNNDIEIISKNWLSKMVGYASQKHIGCVGIKLLYPTLTIQHAGVVLGAGGVAAHAFVGTGDDSYGYFGRLVANYNYGAVTAACLMIEKTKFEKVNGFDENLKVAYNDVDLNLKVLEKKYYNVVLPSIKAIHYESISRGSDLDEKNKERFIGEINYMVNKWCEKVVCDKFYNENLSYYYPFHLDKKIGEDKNE